jgi:hypothetical protein
MGDEETIAKKLNVDPNPKIFKGHLNAKQKEIILSGKFTKEEIPYFNQNYKLALNPTRIEGLILRAKGQIYKVTDPEFTGEIKAKKAAGDESDMDGYLRTLLEMLSTFPFEVPKDYKYTPEAFLNLVFKNVQDRLHWVLGHKTDMEPFNYGNPYKQPYSEFNWKNVPEQLKGVMKSNPWVTDFVRLALTYLRKEIKRPNPKVMSAQVKDKLNDLSRKLMKEGLDFQTYLFIQYFKESLRV